MFFIRKATQKDASDIANVHFHSWNDAYLDLLPASYINKENQLTKKIAMWEQILPQSTVDVWVAYDEGKKIIGFIGYYSHNNFYEITTLYVLSDYQGQGVGTNLIKMSLETLSKFNANASFYLWVLSNNSSAISFYRKNGFEYSGESSEEQYEDTKIIDIKMIRNTNTLVE